MRVDDAWVFLNEIKLLCAQALAYIDGIQVRRTEWTKSRDSACKDLDQYDEAIRRMVDAQSGIGWDIDHLLTIFARVSLALWPIDRSSNARGRLLRNLLGINDGHGTSDRDLRDAVLHADERIDALLRKGQFGLMRAFLRTRDVAARLQDTLLVIDVEELRVHYRRRDGAMASRTIEEMKAALVDVDSRLASAHERRIDLMRQRSRSQGAG